MSDAPDQQEPQEPTELLSIGDVARASGLTPKALRLYDELDLLRPVEVDPHTGYRWYAVEQLADARLVAALRRAGVGLADIRFVVGQPADVAAVACRTFARQLRADADSRTRDLLLLAERLSGQEALMTSTTTTDVARPEPVVGHHLARGAREQQLDAVRTDGVLHAVADGFGGVPGLAEAVLAALDPRALAADPLVGLDDGYRAAAREVARRQRAHPADQADPADPAGGEQIGSTLTALVVGPTRVTVGHVGDSRCHRVRAGRLTLLTRDHTVTQTLVDEGRLTADEARVDDRRVVLNRAVAADGASEPDVAVYPHEPGDRYVLTTDGVHGRLDPACLAALLVAHDSPDEVAASVAAAVERAGADDNHAVLVVDLPAE